MPDLRCGLPVAVFAAVVVALTIAPAAVAAPMTSVTQPPVIEAAGVTAGVWKVVPQDFVVELGLSVICPAGNPVPVSVVFSDQAERITERMGKPCEGEWASNSTENAEGDFLLQTLGGSSVSGTRPEVTLEPRWETPGTHPFLYQVVGPQGVIAQAPFSVSTTKMRLIYRGNPEYPAKCVEPRRAARSTEPEASCLVAETVTYYKGWPAPEPSSPAPKPQARPPRTRASSGKCEGFLLGPDPVDLIEDIRAHGVSCSLARAVAKGSRDPGASFDARTKYRSRGFSCRGRFVSPPGGGEGHIHFHCTRGRKTVTFIHN